MPSPKYALSSSQSARIASIAGGGVRPTTINEAFVMLCGAAGVDAPDLASKRMRWAVSKLLSREASTLSQWPNIVIATMRAENGRFRRAQRSERGHRLRIAAKREAKRLLSSWDQPVTSLAAQPEHHRVLAGLPAEKFYRSVEWLRLRVEAFRTYGRKCCVCGAGPSEVRLDVHHIHSRIAVPLRAFDITNLEVLCEPCHRGKHSTAVLSVIA